MVILIAVSVVVSGCVESLENDVEPESDTDTQEEPETNDNTTNTSADSVEDIDRTVTIEGGPGTTYNVSELSFEEGETVEFVYTHAGGSHDLVLESPEGEDLESTEVYSEAGATESFTYTFDSSGEYMFYCSVGAHRASGMEGTITVE